MLKFAQYCIRDSTLITSLTKKHPRHNVQFGKWRFGIWFVRLEILGLEAYNMWLTSSESGSLDYRSQFNNNTTISLYYKNNIIILFHWFNSFRYPLTDDAGNTKFSIYDNLGNNPGMIDVMLRLPKRLTCKQCVIQWYYTAGEYVYRAHRIVLSIDISRNNWYKFVLCSSRLISVVVLKWSWPIV